ncbi:MAG: hypothetical protein P8N52_01710 [Crocinitomicaceae bacterium]|nr:hypothetical protein [Crocinitomicaceae bacterium]MDG1777654.1 hypothetical protein [Crocinitomicaceae bacterium]
MKWIGERISFVQDKNKTTIVILPEDVTWVKAVMGAWVAMWITIGAIITWAYFELVLSQQENIILIVFMAFWLYFALKVIRSFFWLLWGRELIKIDEVSVSYKKSIKGYGKAGVYYIENITKIKAVDVEPNSIQSIWEKSPWVKGGERIEFEHKGKSVLFGRKINAQDAKLLFRLVSKRVEEQAKKLNKANQ